MTSSRANRFGCLAACLCVTGLALAGTVEPAHGQAPRSLLPTQPLQLSPPSNGDRASPAPGGPTDTAKPADDGTLAPAQAQDPAADKSGIQIDSLGSVTVENVGAIDAASGGFPSDMWNGTPKATIARLLTLLPATPPSHVLRDLRRRLLLTAATIPEGKGGTVESLLLTRARALFAGGDIPAVSQLLMVVPPSHEEEALARLGADSDFLLNNFARGCDTAAAWVETSQDRYWQKARVFCEAMNGAWDKVDFGMRVLIELGDDDEAFFALMRGIGGEAGSAKALEPAALRPLDVAMARGGRSGLPDAEADQVAAWLLRPYMADPNAPPETRIAMAERAEQVGVAAASELIGLYESLEISADLLQNAASVAAVGPGPAAHASLYRAALAQTAPIGRAQAIKQARDIAGQQGRFMQMARVYAPLVGEIPPDSGLGWFAADAALLQLADGDPAMARPWVTLAEREATIDPEARAAWHRAWPAIRLATGNSFLSWDQGRLEDWWSWLREADPENANRRATRILALFEALGDPVPASAWRDLVDAPSASGTPAQSVALSRALADAAEARRLGEAVALILIATGGSGGFSETATGALTDAVTTLTTFGLEVEARRLAFEIAASDGS